ncbi:MAG TPA: translation elongation factor Ts [Patescibacteria group bacterium]|nr:translation elongation factor Ts [Patescibacteria group bacterium]
MSAELIKEIRELTGAGMMDVKEALGESGGDKDKAIEYLRKKGATKLAKKADRVAREGIVEAYIHAGGRIGVLVELNCETDFVARTDDFKNLAKELALHIAAANPLYVSEDQVPNEVIEKEKEIAREQLQGKPENVIEQILTGKVAKYFEETVLLQQPFVKNPDVKVKDHVAISVAKMGENVVIKRFARFVLGN